MNKEYRVLIIITLAAALALILPTSLFYMIGFITIIFAGFLLNIYYKESYKHKSIVLSLIIIFIVGGVLFFLESPIFEFFLLLEVFLVVRTILISTYNSKNIEVEKTNSYEDENKNNEDDYPSIREEMIEDNSVYLIEKRANNFANTIIGSVQDGNYDRQIDIGKMQEALVSSIKHEVFSDVKKEILEKSLNNLESEKIINEKLENLNYNLQKINEKISKEQSGENKETDFKDIIEEIFNKHSENLNQKKDIDIDQVANKIIESLKNDKVDFSNTKHIQNMEIREYFIYAFKSAEKEINIISPWISYWVLENEFLSYLEDALSRGVKIKIVYGIDDSWGSSKRDDSSEKYASMLRGKFKKYKDLLILKKGNTHYKLLICDDKYYLAGSFNFLSFKGDYSAPNTRHEGADYSENKEQIKLKREMYFNF